MMDNTCLSINDTIKYLKDNGIILAEHNLRQLDELMILPAVKTVGGHRRFTIEALDKYINDYRIHNYGIKLDDAMELIKSLPMTRRIEIIRELNA